MIAKHARDRADGAINSFAALARYITNESKAENVKVTNCHLCRNGDASDLERAIVVIGASQALNNRATSAKTYHLVVSFRDGEHPTSEELEDIERHLAEKIGLGEHQRISALHTDTENWHLHVAINLVHPETGRKITPYADKLRLSEACREMELAHGLQRDKGMHYIDADGEIKKEGDRRSKGKGERAALVETHGGIESFASWLANQPATALHFALAGESCSWQGIHNTLAVYNLSLVTRGNGFAIVDRDDPKHAAKASDVGRWFTKTALEKRLGEFKPSDTKWEIDVGKHRYSPRPIRAAQVDRREQQTALYNDWQADRNRRALTKTDAWKKQREREKERRAQLNKAAQQRRASIKASSLDAAARKAAYSQIAMDRVLNNQELQQTFKQEREALRQEHPKAETYRDYVTRMARDGNEAALAALRGLSRGPAGKEDEPQTEALGPGDRKHVQDSFVREWKGEAVAYNVHRNGDVTYMLNGREALRDTGRKVEIRHTNDAAALELGLRLARARFGQTLQVYGGEAFQRRVVETAVQNNMQVKFTDPALEAYRLQLTQARDEQRQAEQRKTAAKPWGVTVPRRKKPAAIEAPAAADVPASAEEQREASMAEAQAWTKNAGRTVQAINKDGRYTGEILATTAHHVIQDVGRNQVVIHDLAALDRAYRAGDKARIQYANGKALGIERGNDGGKGRGFN